MVFRQGSFRYWRRGNKYGARKTECTTGHRHASGLEARVCEELKYRKDAGDISDYEIEKTIQLELEGVYLGTYRVDFVVTHLNGSLEFVEAKGMPLPAWKMKWKILQAMHKADPRTQFRVVTK